MIYSYTIVGVAIVLLVVLTVISLHLRHLGHHVKQLLFGSFIVVTLAPTLFLAGSTIYINALSTSKGPVHWHADFEIWACGQEMDLRDPTGLSNKIGTSTLHEHNDKRIHLEGVVLNSGDDSLGKFFSVIGGSLKDNILTIPVENGYTILHSGNFCIDKAYNELQFFVYKTLPSGNYFQQKITDPSNYTIGQYGNVPPGDCIIIELDRPKERTDRLCTSYQAAKQTGKLKQELYPVNK